MKIPNTSVSLAGEDAKNEPSGGSEDILFSALCIL